MNAGTVLELAGNARHLRRLLILSAAGPIERIAYTRQQGRQRAAWDALSDIAGLLTQGRITYAKPR